MREVPGSIPGSPTTALLGYANGATLWHFRSRDAAADIVAPQYFDASADMLRAGDFILVNLVSDTATSGGLLTVESVQDKTVHEIGRAHV